MPIGRPDLGFFTGASAVLIVLFVLPVLLLIARWRWRMAAARAEEVRRLVWLAVEESARAEIETAALAYSQLPPPPTPFVADEVVPKPSSHPSPLPLQPQCAVCHRHTTTRCARCKSVRYCSGKCQIIHWRQGHKDECHPPKIDDRFDGQESASNLKGLECEGSSEPDENIHAKPVESLSKRPSSESKFSDVFHENDSNETKPFLDTSGTESTSDILRDSSSSLSSFSSQSSSSASSSLPPPAPLSSKSSISSSPPGSANDASAREDSGMCNYVELSKASCDNNFPDGSKAKSNTSEENLTRVPLSQFDCAILSVNLSSTSNIEQIVSNRKKEDECTRSSGPAGMSSCKKEDECTRSSGPAHMTIVGSHNGTNSGPSKDALKCEVHHIHMNFESSQLSSKQTSTERSSSTETYLHRSTLSGGTAQLNLKDLKPEGVYQSNPVFGGSCDNGCLGKSKTLKQSSFSSVRDESSSEGRHSVWHDASPKIDIGPTVSSISLGSVGFIPNSVSDFDTSFRRVVHQFNFSKLPKSQLSAPRNDLSCKFKALFPYDLFVKLYNCEKVELHPCGLTNCGNSCYANAVLQCLAFTRPLTSYLLQGFHNKTCTSRGWCFTCEFGRLLGKLKQGLSPVSPIGIMSHIENIGSNLGNGRQEDAHEFLRYAIDTMQTVCLKEAGAEAAGVLADETTLIQLTFGGYLRSKIKCTRCRGKSDRRERMMDLTVEIHGDIETLEEALARFTASEILDGENKYLCSRCKSYERAKKKLSIWEAPNVLTIALKRFQSGKFGKLNKSVQFPEHLDLAPYMSGTDDKSPVYGLYAVVVHRDIMNTAFSGHYVCYVKSTQGKWYKADDSRVKPVEIETVLTENAYMLLYARCSPRAPSLIRGSISRDNSRTKKNHDPPPYRPYHLYSTGRPPELLKGRLPFPKTDSCSDTSSLLSNSDEGSCSTESTRDYTSNEEYSDYIFGDSDRFSCSQSSGFSKDADGGPPIARHSSAGERESVSFGEDLRLEGVRCRQRHFLYYNATNQSRKLTEESRDREQSSLLTKRTSTSRERNQTFY